MDDVDLPLKSTLRDNIAALTARHREERARAPLGDRIADGIAAFTGSLWFVSVHLVLVVIWIAANVGALPGVPRFDASFVILACAASVEAIFLSTFVLISQNRMARAADRRADLDLHVNLLAEHELSRVAELVMRMAERLDVPIDRPEMEEVATDVAPTQVLDALDRRREESE
jgi:uncharacterized membrane protein